MRSDLIMSALVMRKNKSGSLIPCIIAHGLVDVFSKFAEQENSMITDWIYMAATIVIAIVYCLYLKRLPDIEEE